MVHPPRRCWPVHLKPPFNRTPQSAGRRWRNREVLTDERTSRGSKLINTSFLDSKGQNNCREPTIDFTPTFKLGDTSGPQREHVFLEKTAVITLSPDIILLSRCSTTTVEVGGQSVSSWTEERRVSRSDWWVHWQTLTSASLKLSSAVSRQHREAFSNRRLAWSPARRRKQQSRAQNGHDWCDLQVETFCRWRLTLALLPPTGRTGWVTPAEDAEGIYSKHELRVRRTTRFGYFKQLVHVDLCSAPKCLFGKSFHLKMWI